MLYVRMILISSLLIGFVIALTGCETTVDHSYTTRWYYKGDDDPYKSRASGRTTGSGYTSYRENERKD